VTRALVCSFAFRFVVGVVLLDGIMGIGLADLGV
jgi:hypothetical protein